MLLHSTLKASLKALLLQSNAQAFTPYSHKPQAAQGGRLAHCPQLRQYKWDRYEDSFSIQKYTVGICCKNMFDMRAENKLKSLLMSVSVFNVKPK